MICQGITLLVEQAGLEPANIVMDRAIANLSEHDDVLLAYHATMRLPRPGNPILPPLFYYKDKRGTLYIIVFSSPEDNFKSIFDSSVILYFWFYLLGSPPVKRQAKLIPRTGMFKLIAGATEIILSDRKVL